LKIHDE